MPQRLNMTKSKLLLSLFAGGFLLGICYLPSSLSFMVLFAFVPVLFLADRQTSFFKFFFGCWFSFYISCIVALYTGVFVPMPLTDKLLILLFMYGLYALFMVFPMLLYRYTARYAHGNTKYFLIPAYWALCEYVFIHSEIGMPILSLSSTLSSYPFLLELTAFGGGTAAVFFIWCNNILIYLLLINRTQTKARNRYLYLFAGFNMLFVMANYVASISSKLPSESQITVATVQPNFDNTIALTYEEATNRLGDLKELSLNGIPGNPDLIVWHESAVQGFIIDIDSLEKDPVIRYVRETATLKKAPLLTGIILYKMYPSKANAPATARETTDSSGRYYDVFNGAILIPPDSSQIQVYVKNKVVPFIERMPYINYLTFMERFKINFGNAYPSFGIRSNEEPLVYKKLRIAPVICSEAFFTDYVGKLCENGANLVVNMTSEGWTNKEMANRLYTSLLTPLSIACKKDFVICSNNGQSMVKDIHGSTVIATKYRKRTVLVASAHLYEGSTLYARYSGLILLLISGGTIIAILIYAAKKTNL
jgi:apolipoprotein N-acyltransferase